MASRVRVRRSNGCETCKRRKVKCDETRPLCTRCTKAFMICEYGDNLQTTIFVNSTVSSKGITTLNGTSHVRLPCIKESGYKGEGLPSPQTLDLNPFRENIWISFLVDRLFPGSGNGDPGSWVYTVISNDPTSLSYWTTCCMGAAFFGSTHGMSQAELKEASNFYEKSLRQLRTNLEDNRLCRHPINLAGAFMLSMYELTVFEDGVGFLQHASGCARIIQACGVEILKRDPGRSLYKMARTSVIAQGLAFHARVFLEDEEWREITASPMPSGMRCSFQLGDIMCRIPGLLEDSDRARGLKTDVEIGRHVDVENLRDRILMCLRDLFLWKWWWEEENPNTTYLIEGDHPGTTTVDDSGEPLFDTLIYSVHYHRGREPVLCNSSMIWVLNLAEIWNIENAPARALAMLSHMERPVHTNAYKLPHENITIKDLVEENCRTVEFVLQGEHQNSGALTLILPLRMTFSYIEDDRIRAWLMKIISQMAVHGFRFSKRLRDMRSIARDMAKLTV